MCVCVCVCACVCAKVSAETMFHRKFDSRHGNKVVSNEMKTLLMIFFNSSGSDQSVIVLIEKMKLLL